MMNVTGILGVAKLFGMFGVGPLELVLFSGVVLLLFGGAKLPSLMRNIGRSANEFKRGMAETDDESDPKEKKV